MPNSLWITTIKSKRPGTAWPFVGEGHSVRFSLLGSFNCIAAITAGTIEEQVQ